jgi:putative transposase
MPWQPEPWRRFIDTAVQIATGRRHDWRNSFLLFPYDPACEARALLEVQRTIPTLGPPLSTSLLSWGTYLGDFLRQQGFLRQSADRPEEADRLQRNLANRLPEYLADRTRQALDGKPRTHIAFVLRTGALFPFTTISQVRVACERLNVQSTLAVLGPGHLREVVNTLFYQARTGCPWDYLPHDLVPKSTAWDYFVAWQDGTWQRIVDALRGQVRTEAGREQTPSVAAIDTQSVKTSEMGGPAGYDGNKKVNGRKRHIVVDTLGLLLAVAVTTANLDDGTHAWRVLRRLDPGRFPRLRLVLGDNKYNNRALDRYLQASGAPYRVEVSSKPEGVEGFKPLPVRWVAEQAFACLNRCRRLNREHEYKTAHSEAWIQISAIHRTVRRLRPDQEHP